MDCHEPNTHFRLVGIFKQSDGLKDWAEQLFSHEGSCIWDNDAYETMSNERWRMAADCTQLYITDDKGGSLYLDAKPQKEGNVAMGIYKDDQCTQESDMSFADYLLKYYKIYYGNEDLGHDAIAFWDKFLAEWNHNMNEYKICQPCMAYNLHQYDGDSQSSQNGAERFLENGGGGTYDCVDGAGDTNANQVRLFWKITLHDLPTTGF